MSVFPWYDELYLKSSPPNPMALAARAAALAEYHHATEQEHTHDGNAWFVYGLSVTLKALADAGEYHAIGLLLTGLETIVPAEDRAKLPQVDEVAREPLRMAH